MKVVYFGSDVFLSCFEYFVEKITTFVPDNIQKLLKENGHNWESMI